MLSLVMKDKQIMTPPLTQIEEEMGGLIDAIAENDVITKITIENGSDG